jgi:hypothetical protein
METRSMKHRLVATGIALTAALGLAGLAQAQTYPTPPGAATASPGTTPGSSSTMNPATAAPDSATQPPSTAAENTPGQTPNADENQAQQAVPQPPMRASHATVREAQEALKSRGLYQGPVDGVAGPRTKSAISQFQQRNGLPQTAMLDQRTIHRLISSSNTQSR